MSNPSIEVICPLYNAQDYIMDLNKSILMQKDVNLKKITYILTESSDDSEKILKENSIDYAKIKKQDFNHALTREKAAMASKADIVVFITQDVVIKDSEWLKKLTENIGKDKIAISYSRQKTKYDNIEKYIREYNYPKESFAVSEADIEEKGIKTFFVSDAASAIDAKVFKKLKGYDGKKLPISEDMYFAYKVINNGYRINYEADSVVYHSHKFTLKQIYERYKLTGQFFKENDYLSVYGVNGSGWGLAKYVIKHAFKDGSIKVMLRWLPDMGARWIGMRVGKGGKGIIK